LASNLLACFFSPSFFSSKRLMVTRSPPAGEDIAFRGAAGATEGPGARSGSF
jgi:hypothetical protein